MEDESGFSLVAPLKRTWSRRGQAPILRTSIDHHLRLNLLGALLVTPKDQRFRLSVRSYGHSLSGQEVIAFLQQMLRLISGPIVLVWDRHPIHKRRAVQDFIEAHKRLHMFYFPIAAPDLNPAEFIWTQTTEYFAGLAPHNSKELQQHVFSGVARLRACLLGSRLDRFN